MDKHLYARVKRLGVDVNKQLKVEVTKSAVLPLISTLISKLTSSNAEELTVEEINK
jgi:hypothetical protein